MEGQVEQMRTEEVNHVSGNHFFFGLVIIYRISTLVLPGFKVFGHLFPLWHAFGLVLVLC